MTHPYYRALQEIQGRLNCAVFDFFATHQLTVVDLPLTTGSISSPIGLGSDSLPVQVNLAGCPTYLADSMQFLLELGCRTRGSGVAYKSVSFRGEETDSRHLAQFHHVELEIPGTLEDVMTLGERLLQHLTRALLDDCGALVEAIAGTRAHLTDLISLDGHFPCVTNSEAVRILEREATGLVRSSQLGFGTPTPAGERRLNELLGRAGCLWLTHLPAMAVPFYQALDPQDPNVTLSADLLIGGCETLGSGQRHPNESELTRALEQHAVERSPYGWYCDMHRDFALQTAGFGLGLERYLMWALAQDDIRDCCFLLRRNGLPGTT